MSKKPTPSSLNIIKSNKVSPAPAIAVVLETPPDPPAVQIVEPSTGSSPPIFQVTEPDPEPVPEPASPFRSPVSPKLSIGTKGKGTGTMKPPELVKPKGKSGGGGRITSPSRLVLHPKSNFLGADLALASGPDVKCKIRMHN